MPREVGCLLQNAEYMIPPCDADANLLKDHGKYKVDTCLRYPGGVHQLTVRTASPEVGGWFGLLILSFSSQLGNSI